MLSQIRAFAKSPVANVLLALVLLSFVVFGVRGFTNSVGVSDEVIRAGSRPPITGAMFRDQVERQKQQLEQENQRPLTLEELVANNVDRVIADQLASGEAAAELLRREGVRPSDQQVAEQLRQIPSLFNPVTGQFDKDAYQRLLQENHLSAAQAESLLRDEVAQRQYLTAMAAGLRAPWIYPSVEAALLRERRTFRWFVVGPAAAGPPAKPTDAQLNAFIKENAARFTLPELRQFSVVHFSAAALAPTLPPPSAADVQKRFDFEKDTLSVPEKRSFVEVPLSTPAQGQALQARLARGEDLEAAARSLGLHPAPFADQPKSAVPDKAVADAAFSLKPGETRLVRGDFGEVLVKLLSVAPGKEATLEAVRPKIEAEVRKTEAQDQVYKAVQKYDELRSGGSDLAAAAKAAGQTVVETPPVAASGSNPITNQSAGLPPKALQAAFAKPAGSETDPIDTGEGEYWVVRVDKVVPPTLATLDQIRPQLTRFFVLRDAAQKLQAKAQALAAAVRKGESLEEAAKSVGASPQEARSAVRNAPGFSTDLLGRLFQAKPGEVVVGEDVKLGYVVAKLSGVEPAPPGELAPLVVALRDQTTRQLFGDIGTAAQKAARQIVKPKVDYAKARAALGVSGGASGAPGAPPSGGPRPPAP